MYLFSLIGGTMEIKENVINYRIYDDIYNDMVLGEKTIEFRLLNEKSKSIKVNDIIIFTVENDENKRIKARVVDKLIFDDINELWKNKTLLSDKMQMKEKEEFIAEFFNIFGNDKKNSKIVGIKFVKLNE